MAQGESLESYIRRFRRRVAEKGESVDHLNDTDLIELIGRRTEALGHSVTTRLGREVGDAYLDIKNKPERGMWADAGLDLKRQTYNTISGLARGGQLAGELVGSEQPWLAERAEQFSQKAAEVPAASIERPTDIRWNKPGEVLRGGLSALAQVAPSVVEGVGVGLVGGGVAGPIIKKHSQKQFLREATRKAMKKEYADEAKKRGLPRARDISESLLDERVLGAQTAYATGGIIGLDSIAQSSGEIYNGLYEYTQLDRSDPDYLTEQEVRSASLLAGAGAGLLDSVLPALVAKKVLKKHGGVGSPEEIKDLKSFWRKSLMTLGKGVVLEGSTEAAQEYIGSVTEKFLRGESYNIFDWTHQERRQLVDAGILGAVGGTGFSSVSVLMDANNYAQSQKTDEQLEAENREITSHAAEMEEADEKQAQQRTDALNEFIRKRESGEVSFEVGSEATSVLDEISGTITSIDEETQTATISYKDKDGVAVTKNGIPLYGLSSTTELAEAPQREIVDKSTVEAQTVGLTQPGWDVSLEVKGPDNKILSSTKLQPTYYRAPKGEERTKFNDTWKEVNWGEIKNDPGTYAVAFKDKKGDNQEVRWLDIVEKTKTVNGKPVTPAPTPQRDPVTFSDAIENGEIKDIELTSEQDDLLQGTDTTLIKAIQDALGKANQQTKNLWPQVLRNMQVGRGTNNAIALKELAKKLGWWDDDKFVGIPDLNTDGTQFIRNETDHDIATKKKIQEEAAAKEAAAIVIRDRKVVTDAFLNEDARKNDIVHYKDDEGKAVIAKIDDVTKSGHLRLSVLELNEHNKLQYTKPRKFIDRDLSLDKESLDKDDSVLIPLKVDDFPPEVLSNPMEDVTWETEDLGEKDNITFDGWNAARTRFNRGKTRVNPYESSGSQKSPSGTPPPPPDNRPIEAVIDGNIFEGRDDLIEGGLRSPDKKYEFITTSGKSVELVAQGPVEALRTFAQGTKVRVAESFAHMVYKGLKYTIKYEHARGKDRGLIRISDKEDIALPHEEFHANPFPKETIEVGEDGAQTITSKGAVALTFPGETRLIGEGNPTDHPLQSLFYDYDTIDNITERRQGRRNSDKHVGLVLEHKHTGQVFVLGAYKSQITKEDSNQQWAVVRVNKPGTQGRDQGHIAVILKELNDQDSEYLKELDAYLKLDDAERAKLSRPVNPRQDATQLSTESQVAIGAVNTMSAEGEASYREAHEGRSVDKPMLSTEGDSDYNLKGKIVFDGEQNIRFVFDDWDAFLEAREDLNTKPHKPKVVLGSSVSTDSYDQSDDLRGELFDSDSPLTEDEELNTANAYDVGSGYEEQLARGEEDADAQSKNASYKALHNFAQRIRKGGDLGQVQNADDKRLANEARSAANEAEAEYNRIKDKKEVAEKDKEAQKQTMEDLKNKSEDAQKRLRISAPISAQERAEIEVGIKDILKTESPQDFIADVMDVSKVLDDVVYQWFNAPADITAAERNLLDRILDKEVSPTEVETHYDTDSESAKRFIAEVKKVYEDSGVVHASGIKARPAYDELIKLRPEKQKVEEDAPPVQTEESRNFIQQAHNAFIGSGQSEHKSPIETFIEAISALRERKQNIYKAIEVLVTDYFLQSTFFPSDLIPFIHERLPSNLKSSSTKASGLQAEKLRVYNEGIDKIDARRPPPSLTERTEAIKSLEKPDGYYASAGEKLKEHLDEIRDIIFDTAKLIYNENDEFTEALNQWIDKAFHGFGDTMVTGLVPFMGSKGILPKSLQVRHEQQVETARREVKEESTEIKIGNIISAAKNVAGFVQESNYHRNRQKGDPSSGMYPDVTPEELSTEDGVRAYAQKMHYHSEYGTGRSMSAKDVITLLNGVTTNDEQYNPGFAETVKQEWEHVTPDWLKKQTKEVNQKVAAEAQESLTNEDLHEFIEHYNEAFEDEGPDVARKRLEQDYFDATRHVIPTDALNHLIGMAKELRDDPDVKQMAAQGPAGTSEEARSLLQDLIGKDAQLDKPMPISSVISKLPAWLNKHGSNTDDQSGVIGMLASKLRELGDVKIVFLTDEQIAEQAEWNRGRIVYLNHAYRQDVHDPGPNPLGDVYISNPDLRGLGEEGAEAVYIDDEKLVVARMISGDADRLAHVITHEALHPLTDSAIDFGWLMANQDILASIGEGDKIARLEKLAGKKLNRKDIIRAGELYSGLDQIRKEMIEAAEAEGIDADAFYGLTSTLEFKNELLTDPALKAFLAKQKISPELRNKLGLTKEEKSWVNSAWDALVVLFRRAFGAEEDSALIDSLNVFGEIMTIHERVTDSKFEQLLRQAKDEPVGQLAWILRPKEQVRAIRTQHSVPSTKDENLRIQVAANAAAAREFQQVAAATYAELKRNNPELTPKEFQKKFPKFSRNRIKKILKEYTDVFGNVPPPTLLGGTLYQNKLATRKALSLLEGVRSDARIAARDSSQSLERLVGTDTSIGLIEEHTNTLKAMGSGDLQKGFFTTDYIKHKAQSGAVRLRNELHKNLESDEEHAITNILKDKGVNDVDLDIIDNLLRQGADFWTGVFSNMARIYYSREDDRFEVAQLALEGTAFDNDTSAAVVAALINRSEGKMAMAVSKLKASGRQNIDAVQQLINNIKDGHDPDVSHMGDAKHLLEEVKSTKRELDQALKEESDAATANKLGKGVDEFTFPLRVKYGEFLGELEPFTFGDEATVLAPRMDENGEWVTDESGTVIIDRPKIKFTNNMSLSDREGISRAVNNIMAFIGDQDMRDRYGKEYWFHIMEQQSKAIPQGIVEKEYSEARIYKATAILSSLEGKAELMGYTGKNIASMQSKARQIILTNRDKFDAEGRKWGRALLDASKTMGMNTQQYYETVFNDAMHWITNHPEYIEHENILLEKVWEYLEEHGNFDKYAMGDPATKKAFIRLMRRTKHNDDLRSSLSVELGNRIADSTGGSKGWVQSLTDLDGALIPLYRDPIKRGWITGSRRIKEDKIRYLEQAMKDWPALHQAIKDRPENLSLDDVKKLVKPFFDEEVTIDGFIKPYINSTASAEIFKQPHPDGFRDQIPLPQSKSIATWRDADGEGLDKLFDWITRIHGGSEQITDADFAIEVIKVFIAQRTKLAGIAHRAEAKAGDLGLGALVSNKMLDSRDDKTNIPQEFFEYDSYDDISMKISLGLIATQSVMGRDGERMTNAIGTADTSINSMTKEYIGYLQHVLGAGKISEKANKPVNLDKAQRKKVVAEIARRMVISDTAAEAHFDELALAMASKSNLESIRAGMKNYFGGQDGPFKDFKLAYELLGFHSYMLLNQPKSGFINLLSVKAFPQVFKGFNSMSVKGTWGAVLEYANQILGGALEAVGMELWQSSEYSKYTSDMFYGNSTEDLDFKDYITNVGKGGEGHRGNLDTALQMATRTFRGALKYTPSKMAKEDRTRQPVHLKTFLAGDVFGWFGSMANHGIAVGGIKAYDHLVKKAADFIEQQGIQRGVELHSSDLGFNKEKLREKLFMGGAEGYDFAVDKLIANGLPTVTQMAHDYLQRNKQGPAISKENAIGIAVITMNEISLEGPGAKPAWMYADDPRRWISPLLGWTFAASGQVGKQWRNHSSKDKAIAAHGIVKWLGIMAAMELPMTMAFMSLWDWYDEDTTGKPSSLPKVDPVNMLPFMAAINIAKGDERGALIQRASRGGIGGIGGEFVAGALSIADPTTGSKPLSVDTRVVVASMAHNLQHIILGGATQLAEGGPLGYADFGRPLLYVMGANGGIQQMQTLTNLLPATAGLPVLNKERQVADYIGIRASIKNAARAEGHELKPVPMSARFKHSRTGAAMREMVRTAIANDDDGFYVAYQEAKDAAKAAGHEDPAKWVYTSMKSRNLKRNTLADMSTIDDETWAGMMGQLSPKLRTKVVNADTNFNVYLGKIAIVPMYRTPTRPSPRARLLHQRKKLMRDLYGIPYY